jgi:hypothetical protein
VALPAWGGITALAAHAAANPGTGRFAPPFFTALHEALVREEGITRGKGDKQALVGCIKAAMAAASKVLFREYPQIQPCTYCIRVPGLPRGKSPDYAFRNGTRLYLIEQKSVLRFNEFSQVFLEAMLARRQDGQAMRFAGLFNYLHQQRTAFEQLCIMDGLCLVDRLCVLIPEYNYSAYSVQEVEGLFDDIVAWLR